MREAYWLHNGIGAIIYLLQNIKKIIKLITIGDLKTDSFADPELFELLYNCRH
jgi:hypothetical protein